MQNMQPVNIKLDFEQLMLIIEQCNLKQKLALREKLEKDTIKPRLKKLLAELKHNNITPDDVIKEVEIVRKKRYNLKQK